MGINEWHTVTIDKWVGPEYSTSGIYGQNEAWHLEYTPSLVPIGARRAMMVATAPQPDGCMDVDPQQAMRYQPPMVAVQLTMDYVGGHAEASGGDTPMGSSTCCPWSRSMASDHKRPLLDGEAIGIESQR